MKYLKRCAEGLVEELSKMYGVVFVAGPRQVGKTTMLKKFTGGMNYVALDDDVAAMAANEQAGTFLKDNPPPVFIDEVQKAPKLFSQIKMYVDRTREKGQFYICGSQQIDVMKGVTESMAGRVGLVNLLGLSLREICELDFGAPFLPTEEYYDMRRGKTPDISYDEIWSTIHRGSMPELCVNSDYSWQIFYSRYVATYIDRDVEDIINIKNKSRFKTFLVAVASRCGQLLNVAALARSTDISVPTAESWLSILADCNIIYLLKPYTGDVEKRATRTPKVYFTDTGLCAYLCGITTPEQMKTSPMRAEFFENFVISEIIKGYYNAGQMDLPLYFYRDHDQKEIDLVISCGDVLYPVEIKAHADPAKKEISAFKALDEIPGKRRGPGGIVCLYDRLSTLGERDYGGEKILDRVIPVTYL